MTTVAGAGAGAGSEQDRHGKGRKKWERPRTAETESTGVYNNNNNIYTGGGGRWGSGRAGRGQGWWGGWGCDWGGSCGGGGGRYRSNRFRRHKDDVGPSLYAHTAVCTARPPPLPTHNLSSTSLARTVVVVGVYYVYDSDKNWRRTDTV